MAIITKSDIMQYRQVSHSANPIHINQAIEAAEITDVLPLLGEKFFNAIAQNPSNYAALLNGGAYNYEGFNYAHKGLKAVIALFAYSHYVLSHNITDTSFGIVHKNGQDSERIGYDKLGEISREAKRTALSFWTLTALYLERNSAMYPLFGECSKIVATPKISIIKSKAN